MSIDDKTRILPQVGNAVSGTQLSGIYELDERIAFGGMGEVYKGHNIQTGDIVAIKIVLPEFARDPTILSLFKKEASILNHLAHEAIVRYHVFTIDAGIGRPYLAMEFVDGESLVDLMKRGPMPADAVRRLCGRLASGLSTAHEAGVVHRDLSPDNIILPGGRVERAKIIDFGIARSATVGGETLIGGKFAGKYNYVSPEQLGLFGGEVAEQSDVYSLGLVLVAALRGEPIDMGGSQVEVVEKRRVVPDLSTLDESIRPLLEAMLQPDPANRPASMADIVAVVRDMGPVPESGGLRVLTASPASLPPRDWDAPVSVHPWIEAAGKTEAPEPAVRVQSAAPVDLSTAATAGEPRPEFVAHVRPALLAEAAPVNAKGKDAVAQPPRRSMSRMAVALAASFAVVAGGGAAYLGGVFDQAPDPASVGSEPTLQPKSENLPVAVDPKEDAGASGTQTDTALNQSATPQAVDAAPATDGGVGSPASNAGTAVQAGGEVTPPTEAEPPVTEGAIPEAEGPVEQAQVGREIGSDDLAPETVQPPATDALDAVAKRISWLRDYSGGQCFFATATSATDKAIQIEGFGTSVEPFMQLLKSFQTTFNIEPDVGVRLIEPSQCVVTDFLRSLPAAASDAPQFTLDRTSVPNGTPVSGRLDELGTRKTELILVDHKGMAFNLNNRLMLDGGKAAFNIPIGLSAADQAAKKVVPQMLIAVTSTDGIAAANFSQPVAASELLPKILAELKTNASSTATAKYFRLGG